VTTGHAIPPRWPVYGGVGSAAVAVVVVGLHATGVLGGITSSYLFEAALIAVCFSGFGAVIAARRPENRVGWLFLVTGALAATQVAASQVGLALADATWRSVLVYASEALRLTGLVMIALLLLVFPDGRLLSRRWRWLVWAAPSAPVLMTVGMFLRPGSLAPEFPGVTNPLPIAGLNDVGRQLENLGGFPLLAALLGAIASLVIRYRRASSEPRQQIKIVAFATISVIAFIAVMNFLFPAEMERTMGSIVWGLPGFVIPAAAAVAVLRYGLYDIDRIISRTFSYAIVTAILAGVFALVVVLPASVIGSAPDYVIAAATLIVAALFRPVRRRVQTAVDHRFNRRRYDAEHTIEAFTARLREQVDIDALGAELVGVVERTMQPTHVSLWTRTDVSR
jgi:hypothetical protein